VNKREAIVALHQPRHPRPVARRALRRRVLDSEARYRVLGRCGSTVEVEVVTAPGLAPGWRLRVSESVLGGHPGLLGGSRIVRSTGSAIRLVVGHIPVLRLPPSA
jgi:hypothetical protein